MKLKVVLALSTALLSLVWLVFSLSSAPAVGEFVPTLLSDIDQNFAFRISNINSIATEDMVHLIWSETTTSTFPYGDSDLFYRRLPEGTTIDLSKTTATNGNVKPAVIQATTDNEVCVLWREIGSDDAYHLYLWRSATNTTSISPGIVNQESYGYFKLPEFYCDNEGNARISWVDPVDGLIYWDEATGTQVQIADGVSSTYFRQLNAQNITYLIWSQNKTGSPHFYIWDSVSKTVEQITGSQNGMSLETFVDQNNTIHMVWLTAYDMAPVCYFHWDNLSQITTTMDPCDVDLVSTLDGDKNLHIAWAGGYWSGNTIHYWNVNENITASIATDVGVDRLHLVGGLDDTAHFIWQNSNNGDLHYSNSNLLTDRFVTKASSYILQTNNTVWDFDFSGEIHLVWVDSLNAPNFKHVVYWTPTLTAPITLTDSLSQYSLVDIHVDDQDVVHASFVGQGIFHYWNDQTKQIQTIPDYHVYEYELTSDSDGEVFAFFNQYYLNDLLYWSPATEELKSFGYGDKFFSIHNESDQLFIYWNEQKDYYSFEDMYAMWRSDSDNKYYVYLPTIINP